MPLLTDGVGIRERRLLKGIKLVEFARLMGYSPHHVSQVELGRENGGPEFQRKAAKLLDCEIDDITGGFVPHRGIKAVSA